MTTARKVRQVLGAAFFGALIAFALGAILIIRSPHAHASPDSDAQMVCELIVANPSMHAIDSAAYTLVMKGYGVGNQQAAKELAYAVATYCPQELALLNQWAHSLTIDGSTPEGSLT